MVFISVINNQIKNGKTYIAFYRVNWHWGLTLTRHIQTVLLFIPEKKKKKQETELI